jgi:hypothetical protein
MYITITNAEAANNANIIQNGVSQVVSYESIAFAPATETLLLNRIFFGLGGFVGAPSIVRLRFVALRVLLRLFCVSSTSSSWTSSSLGLYAAAS